MKYPFLLVCIVLSLHLQAQFNCSDGVVYSCQGFISTDWIAGDVASSNNSISQYTCEGSALPNWLGGGLNQNFGQDDIYIFNSIGESGAFNSLQITLTMESDDDLDLIAISPDCSYSCFGDTENSYSTNSNDDSETITIEWEDESTIIIVVEAYSLVGLGNYELEFVYNGEYDFCSYFPSESTPISCANGGFVSGSTIVPICLTTFPTDCPPSMDYHEGEGPYFAYESRYQFLPMASSGTIDIELDLQPGMKAFLYHSWFQGVDLTPTVLIASGSNFISTPYTLLGSDEFTLVIDGLVLDFSPFSFTIDYSGCEAHDPCGDCFTYTDVGGNSCLIDPALINPCGGLWSYVPVGGGGTTTFNLPSSDIVQFPSSGDYVLCYDWNCDINEPNEGEEATTADHPDVGSCCVIVKVGQSCNEPPIAHLSASFLGDGNIGHLNQLNASSSSNADYFAFEFGDGNSQVGTSNIVNHDYALEPTDLTTCVVVSNECGMSKYCMSFDSDGDGQSNFDCGLPFDPYNPPQIFPFQNGNTVSFSGLGIFSGAEMSFDSGDGFGEVNWNSNSVYTYPDDGAARLVCLRISYSCYTICFCYTVGPGGYSCEQDPWPLECNMFGDLIWTDNTSASGHEGLSVLSDLAGLHNQCVSADDGCDGSNSVSPNVPFNRNEIVYEIVNPANNHFGNITIDLIMSDANLDLDIFVYTDCDGAGDFSGCIASSVRNNNAPALNRDAILLEGVPAFDKYYIVVDGQSNAPTFNEGPFIISYTCGDLCGKEQESITCGQTIESTTVGAKNESSYYCNCDNESPLGPAGNYGPEKIYRLDITELSLVTLDLEVLNSNVDLELFLLNDCDVTVCNTAARQPVGIDERITKTLPIGIYYVVVEGHKGDAGPYRLSVTGCQVDPVPTGDCALILQEDFESYSDGELLPTDDNTGRWQYGFTYSDDPHDNSLEAVIEESSGDSELVLIAGNSYFSNVAYRYSEALEGIISIEWDMKVQFVAGELYGGRVAIQQVSSLLDFTELIEIDYGHDANGNYAELWYRSAGLGGSTSTKLADLVAIRDYNNNPDIPSFSIRLDQNLDANLFTLRVDGMEVYTGLQNLTTASTLTERYLEFETDDDQDYMTIDNISIYECEDCGITYDDDCDNIYPVFVNPTSDDNVAIVLAYDNIDEASVDGFQVIDELTGQVILLDNLSYGNCIPGRSYKFCVLYFDADGCLSACCYRITIPLGCTYFTPYYTGDDVDITYDLVTGALPSGWTVDTWYVDGVAAGSESTASVSYPGPTTSYICCFLYDPLAQQYVLCCQKICTGIALACGNVSAIYDEDADMYGLTVAGASEVISWNIDIPTNLPSNGLISDPTAFAPSDYGITPGQEITVSVRYKDANGCVKVCCIIITPPIPQDAVVVDIEDICGAVGSTISLPVVVYNFEDVGSLGFEIFSADPVKIRLERIVNAHPTFSSVAFNMVNDKIILGWDDPQGGLVSISDGTTIFEVEVTILGDFDDPIIVFGSQLEVLGNTLLDAVVNQGTVCIEEMRAISGIVRNESQERMEGFDVRLYDQNFQATSTDELGGYTFLDVTGSEVQVEAFNNQNIKQGVSISDVALIRRHFLQISDLPSDLKLIAADVNRSGAITIADVALARRIFLEVITDDIPNNTSWRFVPESTDISANPLDVNLEDRIILTGSGQPIDNANFVAIKVGDVNNSVNLHDARPMDTRANPLRFTVNDVSLVPGSMHNIPLIVQDFEDVSLFGFEMIWDSSLMALIAIDGVELDDFTNQNYNIQDGKVILGWDEPSGGSISREDGVLLNFQFLVKSGATGMTSLQFDGSEILNPNFEEIDHVYESGIITIGTSFVSSVADLGVTAWPNPFQDRIELRLGDPHRIQLDLYDLNGVLVWSLAPQAKSNVTISHLEDLPSGLFLLRVVKDQQSTYVKLVCE